MWQESDNSLYHELRQVTGAKADIDEDLVEFGLRAVRNIKSNAIVIVQKTPEGILRLTGMGAGQPNRLISTQLALEKTRTNLEREAALRGEDFEKYFEEKIAECVLISDAYFPFADNIELAKTGGINTIVQPGGSIRDKRVFRRAEELGIKMILTGMRHFRH